MSLRTIAAAALAVLLCACNPSGPDAGSEAGMPTGPQAEINEAKRAELITLTKGYLDSASGQLAVGFLPAGIEDEVVALQPNGAHRWDVALRAGVSYRIIGVCDNECSNLDMEVHDAGGNVVGVDVLDDDVPLVNVAPATDQTYTVRLIMKTCTVAPCYSGARVLQAAKS